MPINHNNASASPVKCVIGNFVGLSLSHCNLLFRASRESAQTRQVACGDSLSLYGYQEVTARGTHELRQLRAAAYISAIRCNVLRRWPRISDNYRYNFWPSGGWDESRSCNDDGVTAIRAGGKCKQYRIAVSQFSNEKLRWRCTR